MRRAATVTAALILAASAHGFAPPLHHRPIASHPHLTPSLSLRLPPKPHMCLSPNQLSQLRDQARQVLAQIGSTLRAASVNSPVSTVILTFAIGCLVGGSVGPRAKLLLARYPTVDDIPITLFRQHATLTARVISVSDGDTYRVSHLPPLAGLRRGAATTSKAEGGTAKLSESTMQIRLAAVDCPEIPHFGKPGQPFGAEAKEFVKNKLEGKRVRIKLLARDQYHRAIATVSYGNPVFPSDLSTELLKNGLATVYRQAGAQYDGSVERFDRLEEKAKQRHVGLWSQGDQLEDPATYKRKLREGK